LIEMPFPGLPLSRYPPTAAATAPEILPHDPLVLQARRTIATLRRIGDDGRPSRDKPHLMVRKH